ncbi:putative ATP-dependent helicase Lhr [Microbacterium sorbitolivorans]|uniref:ATP-dependent helicase n=1 Tax=Microbacterium sorbitolivorans TaxID=1867410 RepID=A0A367Y1N2_9MICO|nr:ATP-dependent helicase [Microbacterium sorbitolivorans]RCK59747.1 ATP-dependent helicase [Microbacterium sorbitolivorans]GGF39616.1 putative ATP-dependent helicase Lhr [Microbacterium sorbitolivorans]
MDILESFSAPTAAWFRGAFAAPTDAQAGAWQAIAAGRHALVVAPTGSGKTLSAFLWALDRVFREGSSNDALPGFEGRVAKTKRRTKILYISPLKALGVDVERNLQSPLVGITQAAKRLGVDPPEVSVGVRSGDTPPRDRQRMLRNPPDILITTPESLFLMLTSNARDTLKEVHTVIVDEVHAVASSKRGAHLAVSLERLDDLLDEPAQRIGLSATVRPIDEVARFLGGSAPVDIVAPRASKTFELAVRVPIDDMTNPPPAGAREPSHRADLAGGDPVSPAEDRFWEGTPAGGDEMPENVEVTGSIWPHVEEAIVDRVLENASTIVFANSRRLAERLTGRLNEIYAERLGLDVPDQAMPAQMIAQSGQTAGVAPVLAKAHHGSVSKEQRAVVEEELKSGLLKCVVATSSLELGIDMGAVDLVIQVESPPSAASGLQRIGRAGHQVGEVSRADLFPKHRGDLLHTAVVTERMLTGSIEAIAVPQNPLDILAQQTVAASALDSLEVEGWFETVRRSAPFRTLPRSAFEATMDLLAGRYPSDEFAELRPRIVWDRDRGVFEGRPGAQRLAVTSGGTIPDRGLFGVFIAGETQNARVGELDEEMVYESRVNDVFTLGTTSWRIVEITHDRVNVVPAFGQPGRVPFWTGDGLGRPAELGEALGKFTREIAAAAPETAHHRLREAGLDDNARINLLAHLDDQREATGALPTDVTLTVERGRDEVGDWRIILHSPYGMHVHAPWALAVGARIRERLGVDGSAVASDDGIVARIPDADSEPPGAELFVFDPDELEQIVTEEVGGSALFASRFRECAARSLLMPRLRPGKRMPLWQQRQRSAALLEVARNHPTFPVILETLREVLQDVYDLPALVRLARGIGERRIRLVESEPAQPSPFARDLLFGYVGAFMYEGDSPLGERKAAALSVDPALLGELLGRVEMRELLDPDVVARYVLEVQRLAADRRVHGLEGVADLLRLLGPLSVGEVAERLAPADGSPQNVASNDPEATIAGDPRAEAHLEALVRAKRAIRVSIAGTERYAAIEDAGRLRDALGVALPVGVPVAFTEPVADPLADLVSRFARTHGPFPLAGLAARLGIGTAVARHALTRLESVGRVVSGFFLPEGTDEPEWCDAEGLRRIRMRSLAALRGSIEPVPPAAFARFLPSWHHMDRPLEGIDGVLQVVEELAGVPIPASAWESLILPSRVADYTPAMLDELTAAGEVVWSGHGQIAGRDGWIALHPGDAVPLTLDEGDDVTDPLDARVRDALEPGGAFFASQIADMVRSRLTADEAAEVSETAVTEALWRLVWAGRATNDTFAPVRQLLSGGSQSHKTTRRAPRTRTFRGMSMSRPTPVRNPTAGGRWSLLPAPEEDPTARAAAHASVLLDRYGVVTRGSVQNEGAPGGFAQVYRTLATFEEAGHCRRGYLIEKLGAAQFAASSTIDRLRTFAAVPDPAPLKARVLAATDPANPYGAALAWPALDDVTHRPGRKAGALVVLVDGELVLYLERGGRTVLAFADDDALLASATRGLAETARARRLETLTVEKVNGSGTYSSPLARHLRAAGFVEATKGLTLRKEMHR